MKRMTFETRSVSVAAAVGALAATALIGGAIEPRCARAVAPGARAVIRSGVVKLNNVPATDGS
jgi:hypothetical protein